MNQLSNIYFDGGFSWVRVGSLTSGLDFDGDNRECWDRFEGHP